MYMFYHISLEMCQTKVVEKNKTHILWSVTFLFFKKGSFYDIMSKNIVQPGRAPMTIQLMCIACWIPTATNTHSEYVIPIAFPLQR
jgi:hypothetical protein